MGMKEDNASSGSTTRRTAFRTKELLLLGSIYTGQPTSRMMWATTF